MEMKKSMKCFFEFLFNFLGASTATIYPKSLFQTGSQDPTFSQMIFVLL